MVYSSPIIIRRAQLHDVKLLTDLGREAFVQAFGHLNSPENMNRYLEGSFSEDIIKNELCTIYSTFHILSIENEPAGYARLLGHNAEACVKANKPIELVRFYLLQKWVGRGVAGQLMQECLNEAARNEYDVIWLGVWTENHRAVAFYKKWGFDVVGTHSFWLGDDEQTDYIMARQLV
jgi:diamine N-acetyltransferase